MVIIILIIHFSTYVTPFLFFMRYPQRCTFVTNLPLKHAYLYGANMLPFRCTFEVTAQVKGITYSFIYFISEIYIYAFRRHFYPKRLTVHSGYTFLISMFMSFNNWKDQFSLEVSIATILGLKYRIGSKIKYEVSPIHIANTSHLRCHLAFQLSIELEITSEDLNFTVKLLQC